MNAELRPPGGFTSTLYTLRRSDEWSLLQIDDETGEVAGCAAMPSVIGLKAAVAKQRLRERGYSITPPPGAHP